MQLNEMILLIRNERGHETNMLVTFEDYVNDWVLNYAKDRTEAAKMTRELMLSDSKDETKWKDWYWAGNKSFYARICSGERELDSFLVGIFNDDKEWEFSREQSSEECLKALEVRGIKTDGSRTLGGYEYTMVPKEFHVGDKLHNFNGKDYVVLECFSPNNLLLMDQRNGNMVVGSDVRFFDRMPKYSKEFPDDSENGIEWGHGRYLEKLPSQIDFRALRAEYCQPYEQKGKEFQIEIREILSRVKNIKADTLGDAIDKAMELYEQQEVVLDADDYKGVDYFPSEQQKR